MTFDGTIQSTNLSTSRRELCIGPTTIYTGHGALNKCTITNKETESSKLYKVVKRVLRASPLKKTGIRCISSLVVNQVKSEPHVP